jgi:predicted nucleic acid-binding protein
MYVEADILYSYLKPTDWLKEYSEEILTKLKVKTSMITIVEIEIVAKRDFDEEFANSVLEKLQKIKNLEFTQLKLDILKKAVVYRKKHGLNIFDAIHAATAFNLKEKIITTDRVYDLIEELDRIDPREKSKLSNQKN